MRLHKATLVALCLICVLATACSLPGAMAAPTSTPLILPTVIPTTAVPASPTPLIPPLATAVGTPGVFVTQAAVPQVAGQKVVATQPSSVDFCADAQATTLINSLKTALQTSNGPLLASLVSPTHGMEARLYRDGRTVTYDQQHAKFLFESTYAVAWGAAPGSGMQTSGAFHDTILPDLLDVFNKSYTASCNQVQVGGASYPTGWPYTGINYYSLYYPGTSANGNMDWHTWLIGMQYVLGKPYLYAIMQFKWEP